MYHRQRGFTILELGIILFVIVTLLIIASIGVLQSRKKAFDITAKHDLQEFMHAQQAYFKEHQTYQGNVGDEIYSDSKSPSSYLLKYFQPSKDVVIRITKYQPFTAECQHLKSDTIFECIVQLSEIREK